MPDLPSGSSAEPALYQTICVTTGARWLEITTTCMPLGSTVLSGLNIAARAAELPSDVAPAKSASKSDRARKIGARIKHLPVADRPASVRDMTNGRPIGSGRPVPILENAVDAQSLD